ncbi:hypothetical protein IMZ16_02230 [Cruoricaptor ignavus]|uniref:PIN domain-containing protein n=1 Tax=Cruoricaptor ignavus TaxID=1118202 RepID=A0A7M1T335_9FLAO|nr:PIN domain-containing protein [Cruoricaptor ignavus]QOR74278.1 hypothetical protein IMZ16_02230 [Cruoricaptor ignavus]
MEKVLIGSDVILDLLFSREGVEDAAKLLSHCENRRLQGCISSVALAAVCSEVSAAVPFPEAAEKISQLLVFLETMECSREDMVIALNSEYPDFETSVNCTLAERCYSITAYITGRFADQQSRKPVLSAKDFLLRL